MKEEREEFMGAIVSIYFGPGQERLYKQLCKQAHISKKTIANHIKDLLDLFVVYIEKRR